MNEAKQHAARQQKPAVAAAAVVDALIQEFNFVCLVHNEFKFAAYNREYNYRQKNYNKILN